MKQVPVKLGPLALLLTVISICLTVLAILNYSTALADSRLAQKYADTVSTRYSLEIRGQQYLQEEAEDRLAGFVSMDEDGNGVHWKTIEENGSRLTIGLDRNGRVVCWKHERDWTEDTNIGNLWSGFFGNGA